MNRTFKTVFKHHNPGTNYSKVSTERTVNCKCMADIHNDISRTIIPIYNFDLMAHSFKPHLLITDIIVFG